MKIKKEWCKVNYEQLQNKCNVPKSMQGELNLCSGKDLEKYKYLDYVKNNIEEFIKNGCNLYIYSPYLGNGKTSWAVKILKQHIKNVCESGNTNTDLVGLFVNVDEFLVTQVKPLKIDQSFIKLCQQVDLLVLDDIGATQLTSLEEQVLRSIIDTRLVNGKSTIYTSSAIDDTLYNVVGDRIANKIIESSIIVEFTNRSLRRPVQLNYSK